MPTLPDLAFQRLMEEEMDLAIGLAASASLLDTPENESFGLTADGPPAEPGEAWGVFTRGSLIAVVWAAARGNGIMEVIAAAIPRGGWHMGLFAWMADELTERWAGTGITEILVILRSGGHGIADALADAAFAGPDPESDEYPVGEWRRTIFGMGEGTSLH